MTKIESAARSLRQSLDWAKTNHPASPVEVNRKDLETVLRAIGKSEDAARIEWMFTHGWSLTNWAARFGCNRRGVDAARRAR